MSLLGDNDIGKTETMFLKPAASAGVFLGMSHAVNKLLLTNKIGNADGDIRIFGYIVNFSLALFVAFYVSNMLSELAHQYILPSVGLDERMASIVSHVFTIAVTYFSLHFLLSQGSPGVLEYFGAFNLLLAVVVAEAVGVYIYSGYIAPMLLAN